MRDDEKQQAQFQAGLRNIAEEVIGGLAKLGITLTSKNVDWPAWCPGQPLPTTSLRIDFKPDGASTMHFLFTREQIEDSWNGLERSEVRQIVRNIVQHYARQKEGIGKA